ncbi:MAG: AAA family ATPase, partial [candidate division WOR-3 bacterium]
ELELADRVTHQLELDMKEKEKDIESRLVELNYVEEEKQRLDKLLVELRARVDELSGSIKKHAEEAEELSRQATQEGASLEQHVRLHEELQQRKKELRNVIEQLEGKLDEARNRLFVSMSGLTEIKNRMLELERFEKERQVREERRAEEEQRLKSKLVLLEEKASVLKHQLDREHEERRQLDAEEQALTEQIRQAEAEISQVRGTIERLKGEKRGREEFLKKLSSIGEKDRDRAAPFKRLIDVLKLSNEGEGALEKFFAAEMEYHVMPSGSAEELSEAVLKYGGNFIFFPSKGLFRLRDGEVEVMLHWCASVTEALSRIEKGEEGVFIANGLLLDSRGLIVTDREKKGITIREFREKIKLEKEIAEIDAELSRQVAVLNQIELSQSSLGQAQQALLGKKRQRAQSMAEKEKERIVIETEVRAITERLKEFAWKAEGAGEGPIFSREELASEKDRLEKETETINEILQGLKQDVESERKRYDEVEKEFQELSVQVERTQNLIKRLSEDAQRARASAQELEKERVTVEEKIAETERALSQADARMKELEESHAQLSEAAEKAAARYTEMKQKVGDLHQEKSDLQEHHHRIAQELEKARSKREGLEREKAVLDERKGMVLERLRTEYGIEELDEKRKTAPPGTEAERQRLADKLAAMGEVNFRAEKEFKELTERSQFLETQRADLVQAMESLKKTITKIDAVSKDLFIETFDQISEAFKRYIQMLFKGGKGTLTINPDNGGIELFVQPPGKRVTRMELFSGGEKALISLAFLLSLMDTKPSPFTLMDEIDAPLDDANLASLLEIVKSISTKTQIVLITHNRLTMECSDTMYGITMEDEGISKIVS